MWYGLTLAADGSRIKKEEVFPQLPKLSKDGSNKGMFFVADVLGGKRFAQNYGGYPRSDISLINEQSNMKIAKSMLEDLVDYSSANSPVSPDEFKMSLRSKYCQTPTEVISWLEDNMARRDAFNSSQQNDNKDSIDFSNTETPEDKAIG